MNTASSHGSLQEEIKMNDYNITVDSPQYEEEMGPNNYIQPNRSRPNNLIALASGNTNSSNNFISNTTNNGLTSNF